MQLRAVREAHFLTFEDVDYKGDANMVGERNWSSLIDSQQYGCPLANVLKRREIKTDKIYINTDYQCIIN